MTMLKRRRLLASKFIDYAVISLVYQLQQPELILLCKEMLGVLAHEFKFIIYLS